MLIPNMNTQPRKLETVKPRFHSLSQAMQEDPELVERTLDAMTRLNLNLILFINVMQGKDKEEIRLSGLMP